MLNEHAVHGPNAQWDIHGFNKHFNLHFRVNSLFHHLPLDQYERESRHCFMGLPALQWLEQALTSGLY